MPKYTVHLYPIVRVKVPYVEAESQVEAIKKAEAMVNLYALFDSGETGGATYRNVERTEYGEDNDGFLVDEENDPDFQSSTWYDKDYKPSPPGRR